MMKKISLLSVIGVSTLGGMLFLGGNQSFATEDAKADQKTILDTIDEASLGEWEMGNASYEEDIAEEKEYFQKKYGYEDKFYQLKEEDKFFTCLDEGYDEKLKEEFNPVSGIIRITNENTGEVEEQNHYENIEPIEGATPNFSE